MRTGPEGLEGADSAGFGQAQFDATAAMMMHSGGAEGMVAAAPAMQGMHGDAALYDMCATRLPPMALDASPAALSVP